MTVVAVGCSICNEQSEHAFSALMGLHQQQPSSSMATIALAWRSGINAGVPVSAISSNSSDVIAAAIKIKHSVDKWYQHQELWQQEKLDLE
jgi:hypothetical protein